MAGGQRLFLPPALLNCHHQLVSESHSRELWTVEME